ncbi:MAG: hypothetical protein KDI72_04845, partial [Xanthomonadales bacterium]|nr:hypothetical protein [Xanthomonadales bacterium]
LPQAGLDARDRGVRRISLVQSRMQRRHPLATTQLPDMHMVDFADAVDVLFEPVLDDLAPDTFGHAFEKNMGGTSQQPPGAVEDQQRDQDRYGR